ncbi:DUF456 domain-containing protein [Bacillus sonorensis]|uniref:DUF456 domain-containing protein n=2 Tax=Bacillus sonorensis TaxID=119858 RepID=M5P605_9BACI|nr:MULTISPECIES: DUF456 domain-containing protein [Bacillus]TWK76146.1 hypothetical protein CHCC20335_3911 [Bacillus paralicheniformis]ASB88353.1 uncharacterized protein S101395_01844 [Bacillus sonorensis]EME74883.1 hypothetical protein BSONL12_07817 [Bacillus sonorensis L12]MBG9916200.1 membrane protein [Bacillus sonorensis]MCF7617789.1 DUF456 domain-containing protein [Bacillus sonorensis]
MGVLYWIIIAAMFVIAFAGLVFPIIPSVVFIVAGFLLYGFLFTFEHYSYMFWIVEGIFTAVLFAADYIANLLGVKRFGGSRAAIWGSTVGLLIGPFVIPVAGIILGPFIGALAGEMIVHKKDIKTAAKIGVGSLIGFISGVLAKSVIQLMMIGYFLWTVLY